MMVRKVKSPELPVVSVTTFDPLKKGSDNDWYTPKALRRYPRQVDVVVGRKGKGRVRCAIEENDWEHACIELSLSVERVGVLGWHSDTSDEFGQGEVGTFTVDAIDRMIAALTIARDEANRLGLFTPRPTPKSIADVLAVTA